MGIREYVGQLGGTENNAQIRIRLDVCSIHEHGLRRQIPSPGHFFQHPAEHALDHFCRKAMAESVADRCEVRQPL